MALAGQTYDPSEKVVQRLETHGELWSLASRPCWKRMPKASANLHRNIWMEVFGSGLHADSALSGWLLFELSLQHFRALGRFLSGSMQECLHCYEYRSFSLEFLRHFERKVFSQLSDLRLQSITIRRQEQSEDLLRVEIFVNHTAGEDLHVSIDVGTRRYLKQGSGG